MINAIYFSSFNVLAYFINIQAKVVFLLSLLPEFESSLLIHRDLERKDLLVISNLFSKCKFS